MSDGNRVGGVTAGRGVDATASAEGASEPGAVGQTLLPSPDRVSANNAGTALAEAMLLIAWEQRKASKMQRQSVNKAIEISNQRELSAMQEAADKKHSAAVANAVGQIVSGALGAGGVAASYAGDFYRNVPIKGLGEMGQHGLDKVGQGVFGLFAAGSEDDSDKANIAAKEASQYEDNLKDARGEIEEDERAAREAVSKALNFYKEYSAGVTASQQAAFHRA